MFRAIKLKLPPDPSLLETGRQFREACQVVLDCGFSEKTFNRNRLNRGTCRQVRGKIPPLIEALVQTERGAASESPKRNELIKEIHGKSLAVRYGGRIFRFYPDHHTVPLTTVRGRLVFPVAEFPLIEKYRGKYTNVRVCIDTKNRKESMPADMGETSSKPTPSGAGS